MKPFSNTVNIPLLIIAIGVLAYFLIDLETIVRGIAVITGPIYPLYISIGVSILTIMLIISSILARIKWERDHKEEEI